MPKYDYVVIGAGQGGSLARLLAERGARVALIEKQFMGGTCTNVGCTPTKAHIAAAKAAHGVLNSSQFGIQSSLEHVDLKAVVSRTRSIVESFRNETEANLVQLDNLTLIYGEAKFVEGGKLRIELREGGQQEVEGQIYVVAVGSAATVPSIKGLADIPLLTNVELLQLEEVPSALLILGGGYIACEFAQMFARFGAHVTVVQNKPFILPREDEDISMNVERILKDSGVNLVLDQEVESIQHTGEEVEATWAGNTHRFSHVLVATGQAPQTAVLNLEAVGVKVSDSGHVQTDDYLRTSNDRVFALGDCKGGPAFTHMAYDDARILRDGLLDDRWRSIKERPTPYTVFLDPQLGRIGMTEKEAQDAGKSFDVATLQMKDTARGAETGQDQGMWKVLIERDTDLILGGAFLSGEGGETMAVVEIAMQAKMPYSVLRDGIFAHPTWAEALNNLFIQFDSKRVSTKKSEH